MTYIQLKRQIEEYKKMPGGTEKSQKQKELQREISNLFVKTQGQATSLIGKLQAAERSQNAAELSKGYGSQIDRINREAVQVLRLYKEIGLS